MERGDIWQADGSAYHGVHLFQSPENMPRAIEKARAELEPRGLDGEPGV